MENVVNQKTLDDDSSIELRQRVSFPLDFFQFLSRDQGVPRGFELHDQGRVICQQRARAIAMKINSQQFTGDPLIL